MLRSQPHKWLCGRKWYVLWIRFRWSTVGSCRWEKSRSAWCTKECFLEEGALFMGFEVWGGISHVETAEWGSALPPPWRSSPSCENMRWPWKLQRLTQGTAASKIFPEKGRRKYKQATTLSILEFWGGRGSRGLNCRKTLLTRVGEQTVNRFVSFQKENSMSKSSEAGMGRKRLENGKQIWVEATKCVLGGEVGQFNYGLPRRVSSNAELWSSSQRVAGEYDFTRKIFMGSWKTLYVAGL